ncbi:MAG: magnesium transporter CorA family protein [Bacillota bacterium]
MIKAYVTREGRLTQADEMTQRNSWVNLVAPGEQEVAAVASALDIPADFLTAALDAEEQPRVEVDGQRVLLLLRCPVVRPDPSLTRYETLPLAVIVTPAHLVTVCLEPNEIVAQLVQQPSVHTAKRTLFVLQVLYRTAAQFLRYLRQIDRRTDEIERALHQSLKNEELIKLLELAKSLVYFTTSLRANQIVMDKLMRLHLRSDSPTNGATANDATITPPAVLKLYDEDRELLEDVITENRQAIEMADIYSNILSGMMDAFASVISNNLNMVMKFLTSVTIVLALPTIVASLYGMNVPLPMQESPVAFWGVLVSIALLSGAAAWWLARRRMF